MVYNTYLPFLEIHERKVSERLHIKSISDIKGPLIAIGGFAGVGKDTLALNLRDRLNAEFGIDLKIYGAGAHIREYARREGFSGGRLDEFLNKIKNDEIFARDVDHFADKQTLSQALGSGRGIFIGRMAPLALGKWAVSIWVSVDPKIRAARLVNDGNRPEYGMSEEEVFSRIEKRDNDDISRLERIYSISLNLSDIEEKIDLLLDNTDNSIEQSTEIAYSIIKSKYKFE